MKVLLTHTPQSRAQYYGARSLDGLQAIARVKLHEANAALDAAGLIEAAGDVDIIVADRLTAGPGEIFPALPKLRAFVRCAVDIRNIDVDAARLISTSSQTRCPDYAEDPIGYTQHLAATRQARRAAAGRDERILLRLPPLELWQPSVARFAGAQNVLNLDDVQQTGRLPDLRTIQHFSNVLGETEQGNALLFDWRSDGFDAGRGRAHDDFTVAYLSRCLPSAFLARSEIMRRPAWDRPWQTKICANRTN